MKTRVVFRADGNGSIGYGHFVRSLGIADLIKDDFYCVFAIQSPTKYQQQEINKICKEIIKLDSDERHWDQFLKFLNAGDIVVLDNYYFTADYQLKIRALNCKVIFIDDHNDKNYVCDALINNIPGFKEDSFNKQPYTKLYLGIDYALLRNAFFDESLRHVKKIPNSFFLSFGGADIYNLSNKILVFLKDLGISCSVNLLVGDAYQFPESLKNFEGVNIYTNINATQVAQLMAKSDICIVPASSLLNETASIGSKILVGFFADNQVQPYKYFVENRLAIGLGDYRELSSESFSAKLQEVYKADYLVTNQEKKYFFQQPENLKRVFNELQHN